MQKESNDLVRETNVALERIPALIRARWNGDEREAVRATIVTLVREAMNERAKTNAYVDTIVELEGKLKKLEASR